MNQSLEEILKEFDKLWEFSGIKEDYELFIRRSFEAGQKSTAREINSLLEVRYQEIYMKNAEFAAGLDEAKYLIRTKFLGE